VPDHMDQAMRHGMDNVEVMELARRHCLKMEFTLESGPSMVEQATGVPLSLRQVRCPVALGGMSSNFRWIATDFYRENCVGCDKRASTGEMPNLATVIADEDAHAEKEAREHAERVAAAHEQWVRRDDARRAVIATSNVTMGNAYADLGKLDTEPGTESDPGVAREAVRRLNALAERAADHVTADFVTNAVELAGRGASIVLEPLRRLAARRPELAPQVLDAALGELRRRPDVAAGRCLADLQAHLDPAVVDDAICRSAVMLASVIKSRYYDPSPKRVHDPVALAALADSAPQQLLATLRGMLPPPPPPPGLVLTTLPPPPDPDADRNAAAAAGAARTLAPTHPDLVANLVEALARQLTANADSYLTDDSAPSAIERALAVCIVLNIGVALEVINTTGANYRGYVGDRMVWVLTLAHEIGGGDARWRQPGDPTANEDQQAHLLDVVVTQALARLTGDWGNEARSSAADLLKQAAEDNPVYALTRLSGLLGGFLDLLEASQEEPPSQFILPNEPNNPDSSSEFIRGLERMNRNTQFSSSIYRTLQAVEAAANADAVHVATALVELIVDERDTERGTDVAWRLIKLLGDIGRRHGHESGVLNALLPAIHTYMVGVDPLLQVEAIDAWTTIAAKHPLPSSLGDLLPAFAEDNRVGIAAALARASTRMQWSVEEMVLLLVKTVALMQGIDARAQTDAFIDAVRATKALLRNLDNEAIRNRVEPLIIDAIEPLDGYRLRDVLDRSGAWSRAASVSPEMAKLRLRQAADPRINDRWNASDDEELCELLACGPGLLSLDVEDLASAAAWLGPDYPLGCAEFVEVAWRAGRVTDALDLLRFLLDRTPTEPSHADQRAILEALIAATLVDAEVVAGGEWGTATDSAIAATAALADGHDRDFAVDLAASVEANAAVRRALDRAGFVTGADAKDQLEHEAADLAAAGKAVAAASARATPTGKYLRAVAAACEIGAHVLRSEAATFDANIEERNAHSEAAQRTATLLATELRETFEDDDPLVGALIALLDKLASHVPGSSAADNLRGASSLLLPLPIVMGPRRRTRPDGSGFGDSGGQREPAGPPVAVALVSLDGHLITGPAVLRGGQVYELSLKVQTDEWPTWAETLDAEFLTHLKPEDVTLPHFTWRKSEHDAADTETYEQAGSAVLRFSIAAGRPGIPMMLQLTWRGTVDGKPRAECIDVSGHRELRMRPYDETRDRLTGSPVFDERLLKIYDQLATAGYDENQLQAFCRLMTSICRAGLSMTWEKRFARGSRVLEREFHDELHSRLLADPELGGRVDRNDPLALGFLDTRHDGITAELKVERRTPVTRESAPKYMGQPTQYAAADGARLSILAILDMSPKTLPVGTPENYLFTLEPRLHGLTNPEAPSLVVTLVVNGNMPTPSSWSRRKAQIAGSEDPPLVDPSASRE
jgi:hypothetical protein